jgi:hypothetical protein
VTTQKTQNQAAPPVLQLEEARGRGFSRRLPPALAKGGEPSGTGSEEEGKTYQAVGNAKKAVQKAVRKIEKVAQKTIDKVKGAAE